MAMYACELPPAQLKYVIRKIVLLWGHEDLLGFSVEFLLNHHKELDVIRVADDQGTDTLLQIVEKTRPHIVILQQNNDAENIDLPYLLISKQQSLKVIIVNLLNNSVEIINKQQVCLSESADLLSIVEGCPRLPYCAEDAEI